MPAHDHAHEVGLLLAELEVIEAEALLLASGFRRALFPHEQAAGVDFAAIATEVDTAAGRIAERMSGARWAIRNELGVELGLRIDADRFPDLPHRPALDYLTSLRDPSIRSTLGAGITAQLVDAVRDDLAAATQAGYARTLAEARAQGIPLRGLPDVADLAAIEDELDRSAIRIGRQPVERIHEAAGRWPYDHPVYNMTPDEVITGVTTHLDDLSDAPDVDVARQESHKLHGAGRAQAADALPEPAAIYASELLDRATCGPCSLVDGRRYASMAAARLDYPEGRYRDCLGGARCRGTLVFVWPEEVPPTVDDTLDPPPVAPTPDGTPPPADPGAGDWKGRLGRLRAQRPDEWAPSDATPFDSAGWSSTFQRTHGRRPNMDEHRQAEAAHNLARYEAAAQHEAIVRQAGTIVREEVDRRLVGLAIDRAPVEAAKAALADAEEAYRAARNRYKALDGTLGDLRNDRPAYEAANAERLAEIAEANRLAQLINNELRPGVGEAEALIAQAPAQVYRDVLAEVQEMGSGGARHTFASGSVKAKGTVPVEEMAEMLPRRWVDASVRHSQEANPLYVGNIERGHYRARDTRKVKGNREVISRLNTSGDRPAEMRRVAVHELGHRIEHVLPEVRRLEHAFYRRRTMQADGTQEGRRWLGPGYGRDEVARPDRFANLYMGKDYGNKPDSYYELLSMGNEALFAGRYDGLVDDNDFRDFILGLFTMV